MRDARWGVMTHFLSDPPVSPDSAVLTAEEWNRRVEGFDLPGFVQQLKDVGAPYLIFTLGQWSGFFCSPNATYDRIVGENPSRLSRRDLVGELAEALAAANIRLIAWSRSTPASWFPLSAIQSSMTTPQERRTSSSRRTNFISLNDSSMGHSFRC